MEKVTFENAKTSDIPWVISCMKENLFHTLENTKEWRIFYEIPQSELTTYIDNEKNIFLCAKEWDIVLGYTLAYELTDWMDKKTNRFDELQISENDKEIFKKEKILYWRHVAINKKFQGLWIWKILEEQMFNEAKSKWYKYIVAEIMKSPLENIKSMNIHKKVWFETKWEINYKDLTIWNVMVKNI